MKVYVLIFEDTDIYDLIGVFTSLDKAIKHTRDNGYNSEFVQGSESYWYSFGHVIHEMVLDIGVLSRYYQ
jgi:hypothetical protein